MLYKHKSYCDINLAISGLRDAAKQNITNMFSQTNPQTLESWNQIPEKSEKSRRCSIENLIIGTPYWKTQERTAITQAQVQHVKPENRQK